MKNNILNKIIENKKGFSLLELLIYIAMLSILMVVVSNMFISFSKGHSNLSAKNEVDSSIRFAGELLRQDLKNATEVSTPSIGAPSSTLVLVREGNTITYDVSSGILRRKVGTGLPVNITNSDILVGTPVFTRIENTNLDFSSTNVAIKINMTFSYNSTNPDMIYSKSLQTTVNLFMQ